MDVRIPRSERKTRAFLDREINIADTVVVRARVPAGASLPDPLKVGNPLGNLDCSWEAAGDSIVISRKLFVRAGELPPENVKYYNEILSGWQKTMGQGVAVEGVDP